MLPIKKLAYLPLLVVVFTAGSKGVDKTAINTLWSKFETMRKGTPTLHQEFEVTQHSSTYHDSFSRYQVSVDLSQNKWRDKVVGDLGDSTQIFDGQDVFETQPEGTEYKRVNDELDKKTSRFLNRMTPDSIVAKQRSCNNCRAGFPEETIHA
jgi:hypothetical protein